MRKEPDVDDESPLRIVERDDEDDQNSGNRGPIPGLELSAVVDRKIADARNPNAIAASHPAGPCPELDR